MIVPLFVGREKSIARARGGDADRQADSAGRAEERERRRSLDRRHLHDGHARLGAAAPEAADGTVKVLVEGTRRADIRRYTENESYFEAEVERVAETVGAEDEIEALARSVVSQFESYVKLNKKISPEVLGTASQIEDIPSSPTPSPRISPSRSPRSSRSSRSPRSPSGWSASSP